MRVCRLFSFMPSLTPKADESQAQFALRFHESMQGEVPQTDERTRLAAKSWRENRANSDALERVAREKFSGDKFVRVHDIPVFAEHTTKDKDGNVVVYDRAALEAIATRCNERILDTGDFCPITDGHTPDEDQADKDPPEILGYAGPYKLGMIGNKNPRWAIFADEFHYKQDAEKLQKRPRRSVELWTEERMEDRFFDPIAALGAETPRLDLGLAYSKRLAQSGKFVTKYAAKSVRVKKYQMGVATPPGANMSPKKFEATGLPSNANQAAVGRQEGTKTKNAAPPVPPEGGAAQPQGQLSMPITPDDCKTIVDALESLDWVQEWKQLAPAVREMVGAGSSSGSSGSSSGSSGFSPSGESDDEHASGPSSGSPSFAPSGSPSGSPSMEVPSGSPSGFPEKHAAGDDDDESDDPSKHCNYEAPGAPAGGEELPPGGAEKGKKYASAGTVGDDNPDPKGATAVGTINKTSGQTVASKELMKMAREKDKKDRYERKLAEQATKIQELENRDKERSSKERAAVRYHRLDSLKSQGYTFELAEELEETKDYSDEQFDKHCNRIQVKYQKAPVDAPKLPTPTIAEQYKKPDEKEKAIGDKVKELNDLQNRQFDECRRSGQRPPARKDYYMLRAEAEKAVVKGAGEITKTA